MSGSSHKAALDPEQALKAARALLAYIAKKQAAPTATGAQSLLQIEETVHLGVTLFKIPDDLSKLPIAM
jgi:hypothetical protein